MRKFLYMCLIMLTVSGCSVFGKSGVEIAPYTVLESVEGQAIEVRRYDTMVLVSTPMSGGMDEGKNAAFRKLFNYISGENSVRSDIAMTAPVLMRDASDGQEIPMTAPVFMHEGMQAMMSFVLPASYTLETAPKPKEADVSLHHLSDYTVAAITFSGFLDEDNIKEHRQLLAEWIAQKGYTVTGDYQAAGYNPPFTIPAFRRNEVLIPVKR